MTTICICGAGTMGTGIAQVSAAAGFATLLFDVNEAAAQKAEEKLKKDLGSLVDKGKLTTEKRDSILTKIHFTSDYTQCMADVVIEAIIEKPEIKIFLFNQLATINSDKTIFASNTS